MYLLFCVCMVKQTVNCEERKKSPKTNPFNSFYVSFLIIDCSFTLYLFYFWIIRPNCVNSIFVNVNSNNRVRCMGIAMLPTEQLIWNSRLLILVKVSIDQTNPRAKWEQIVAKQLQLNFNQSGINLLMFTSIFACNYRKYSY